MRRFVFLSLLLHGIMLMLLFSWEIPEAGKILPRNVIQVSLVERGEEETPPVKVEKAAEKPKGERKAAKENPRPLFEPKEILREIPKEVPKGEKNQKEEEAQTKPDSPPEKSGPLPEPVMAKAPEPAGNQPAETAQGTGGEKKGTGISEGGGAFLEVSLNPAPGNKGISDSGGEKQARILEGEGGYSDQQSIGPPPSTVDPILLQIMRRIEEAKRYPRAARRMGIEGKTVVRFKLKPGGQVETVEVVESSGSEILDKASLETVREAVPLPYKEGWLKVGIVFKIL